MIENIYRNKNGQCTIQVDGERIKIPSPIVNKIDINEGDKVNIEEIKEKRNEIAKKVLSKKMDRYLARYVRTKQQLRNHYKKKGYRDKIINEVIKTLEQSNIINDKQAVKQQVRKIKDKKYGRAKMVAKLRQKGISKDRAENAVNNYFDKDDFLQKAKAYVKKNENVSDRKLSNRLNNRGFSRSIIRQVIFD